MPAQLPLGCGRQLRQGRGQRLGRLLVGDGDLGAAGRTQARGGHARAAQPHDEHFLAKQAGLEELHQRTFRVSRSPRTAQEKETIQKRTTMRDSGQPIFSKWWWMGAMRKMRLFVIL